MIKTLHAYVSRDLARITALALVALTMVMTIVAIIEPLRKLGLSSAQAFSFFAYTLPVMFSLTLPVAALFATTIVYGRFSQDNELLACRASGISTVRLLKPALVLGAVVTAVSLLLNMFVAPELAAMGESAVRDNIRSMAYHRLRTRGYLKLEYIVLHADKVYPEQDMLQGVVLLDTRRREDHRILVASKAHVNFEPIAGETNCSVHLGNLAVVRTSSGEVYWEQSQQTPPRKLTGLSKEKPTFFNWGKLVAIQRNPALHPEIRRELVDIRRSMCKMMLAKDVVDTINAGLPYVRLTSGTDVYQITAGAARVEADFTSTGGLKVCAVLSEAVDDEGRTRPVEVSVTSRGAVRQRITSSSGKVWAEWMSGWLAEKKTWLVGVELAGPAEVRFPFDEAAPSRRGGWSQRRCALPEDIRQDAESIALADIYEQAEGVTDNSQILSQIAHMKNERVPKLLGKVTAEIHGRLAYCLSCFMLVAMGAALGVIFRGGQMISAFALSVVPAAIVIVMVLMGKEIIANPDSPRAVGLMSIWGGNAGMVVANGAFYWYLARK